MFKIYLLLCLIPWLLSAEILDEGKAFPDHRQQVPSIYILADGSYWLNGEQVSTDQLTQQLRHMHNRRGTNEIRVQVDDNAAWRSYRLLISLFAEHGIDHQLHAIDAPAKPAPDRYLGDLGVGQVAKPAQDKDLQALE